MRRPTSRRLLRLLAWTAGVVVVAVGVPVAWLTYQLSGGWPVPETDPDDRRVVAAHERWAPVVQERREDLVAELEGAGLVVLGVNEADSCSEGQNNWKIRDGYGLRCSLTWRVVLGAPAGPPAGPVTAVHEVLGRHGMKGWTDATGRERTLLTRLEEHKPHHERVATVSYRGTAGRDGETQTTHLSVDVARVQNHYVPGEVIYPVGHLRGTTGPSARELEEAERGWLAPAGRGEGSPWVVTLSEQVPYFTR